MAYQLVESFQITGPVEQFPPTIAMVESLAKSQLPENAHILQWAIVKTDPLTRHVWLEGSYAQ